MMLSHYCPVVEGEEVCNALLAEELERNFGIFDLKLRGVECYPFVEQRTRKEADEYRSDDIFPNYGSHTDA